MSPSMRLCSLALWLLASGCSRGEPVAGARAPIANGTPSDNRSVVLVMTRSFICSGTLITPTLVLTARHCVSMTTANDEETCLDYTDPSGVVHTPNLALTVFDPSEFRVWDETVLPASFTGETVSEVFVLPGTETSTPLCNHDVAILHLSAPLTGTPIEPRLDSPPVVGEVVSVIGYGRTMQDGPDTSGTRRVATGDHVAAIGPVRHGYALRFTDSEWDIDSGGCNGDSGGPAIGEDGRIVGTTSRGASSLCNFTIYERVDVFADFIRSTVRHVAVEEGVDPPSWAAEPVPDAGLVDDASMDRPDAATMMPPRRPSGCSIAPTRQPSAVLAIMMGAIALLCAMRRVRGVR